MRNETPILREEEMEEKTAAAENIISRCEFKPDIWAANTEEEYHESK